MEIKQKIQLKPLDLGNFNGNKLEKISKRFAHIKNIDMNTKIEIYDKFFNRYKLNNQKYNRSDFMENFEKERIIFKAMDIELKKYSKKGAKYNNGK